VARIAATAAALVLLTPAVACAEELYPKVSAFVHMGLSAIGLVVAVTLLVETLTLRRVAFGGAVAERIGLVVLATVCLAASALAEWGTQFVVDLTLDQMRMASQVLVIVAMALLAAYFWNVRSVLSAYLDGATSPPAPDIGELEAPADEEGEGV
jgi:electron transfer flavoprotein alpha subunit